MGHCVSDRAAVLIIDDDPDICELVTTFLTETGYTAFAARSGAQALDLLETVVPVLILLDLNMREMSGPEFIAAYRTRSGPHASIIVFSAARNADRVAEEWGADGFLAKPFDLWDLLRLMPGSKVEGG
ncbi:MAG: response regulator [Chloroflexi bacterium]|nr:response regulator [Chloroflexota bacterium]